MTIFAVFTRIQLSDHMQSCPKRKRPCRYSEVGCPFVVGTFLLLSYKIHCSSVIVLSSRVIPKGDLEELSSHDKEATLQHLGLVSHVVHSKRDLESSEHVLPITAPDTQKEMQVTDRKIMAFHSEMGRLSEEVSAQIAPLKEEVTKLVSSMADLSRSFSELTQTVQTLQVTSYNGKFMWTIPEVAQKLKEEQTGKNISWYSGHFFTSQYGYKLRLRLYLNGYGSGRGTHLSLYLIVMKGEYDALLSWPFQQEVTMMLLDQDKRKNIVLAFLPERISPCFQQPQTDMNIPAGFPQFAPLWLLSNPSYVRNDTLFLKVIVDKTGLDQP